MQGTGGPRLRWSTAIGLCLAVVMLSSLDVVPLVVLPLSLILLAVPFAPRGRWLASGICLWLLGVAFPSGALGQISRGWALLLGGAFLMATLWRPLWGVLPRSLLAVCGAFAVGLAWLAGTGSLTATDHQVRSYWLDMSRQAVEGFRRSLGSSAFVAQFAATAPEMARVRWELFPALVALQSIAALGLACWLVDRLRRGDGGPFSLQPFRAFRFNDQLVWALIAGIVLVLLPVGAPAMRVGSNVLLFMAILYALRGTGILVFMVGAAPTFFVIVLAMLALSPTLYAVVFSTTALVGLADTWVDLRARASLTPRS